ncbi:MAG: chromosome segregation protein SMC [Candidatus Rokubacteria bacterium]|nr:chromosome segregation protein SMC [Candidatus Rokubacteria bacterium]MBI2553884.1 chromosome segregation protein SMC [Candidatus Rokubacteria bacterium]
MRLEKIVVHGFKSFGEKTEFKIFSGITAIVGPNGCGKTNLADAVRWALGEQSPKSLRGHKMEDVIFHGSASHKPLGLADVELVFANDGAVAVPWSEVGVGRRLYRTGESEYLLNRNVCRLRDILDLFIGTGVNPKAYALMDQERLNHVLTAKPYERRVFIEEAAGITRYKQQRAETLGKLDATRQNLLRVRDVMDEVKRQLGSIERQAKKAQQYKTLHAEQQGLALALLAADYSALARQEVEHRERIDALRREEEVTRVRMAGLAAQEATQRSLIQETEHRLSDLHQSVQKIQGEVERLLERREQMGSQIRELGEEDLRLQEEIRLVEERINGLRTDRDSRERQLEGLLAQQRRRGGELETLEAQRESLRGALLGDRERLETLRLDSIRAAGERAELTRAIAELREREAQFQRRRERLAQEVAAARSEADGLTEMRGRVEASRRQVLEELSRLEGRRSDLERQLAERGGVRDQNQAHVADLRLAEAACRSRQEALERLEREREGYGAGVRAVFDEGGVPRLSGVLGTVADLLEVPSGLEAAVEAVLGDRLQWVVVQRFADAKAGIGYLETSGAGAATFLPLETLPPENGLPRDEGEVRWAARLVGSRHPVLLHHLLGRVAVVPHLEQAEARWRRNGTTVTYVTRSGEVLWSTGRLTGGRGRRDDGEHSLLGRKRAIRELADDAARLGQDVAAAQGRAEAVQAELATLRAEHSRVLEAVQTQAGRRLEGDKDLEQVLREIERVTGHLATLGTEERQLVEEVAEAARERAGLEAQARVALEAEGALERTMAELRATVEASQEREASLATALTTCRVEWAAHGERVEAIRRELAHMDELAEDLAQRRSQAEERRSQLSLRRTDLSREREQTDERARRVAADRDRLEAEERGIARQHAELVSRLQEIEAAAGQSQRALDQVKDQLHGVELKATEGRVRREELEQEALRRFGVEAAGLPGHHDPARDLQAARGRLGELTAKLEAMGPVNLVADEEYRELEERLGFLRTQHDDLVASIKDLEKAIRGMTRTAQERFVEAFEAINRHFGQIFGRLFEGGRAELRLVEPEEGEDSLETGVELMAQPRGKRLQQVTLLSGGEKALTGLALLFAIFYFRPSPFCVLDEVDAPLDDANIHRFLRVLRELCQQTQFIVITHNRKTMEAADVLYGITMEEPGLSRLVSVRLTD